MVIFYIDNLNQKSGRKSKDFQDFKKKTINFHPI